MTGLQRDGAEAGTRRREASLAPQGLLGPRDPLDPPGGEVTQEAVLREFREMLKDATERRFSGLLDPLLPEGMGRWLVAEAFHCRLKGPVLVDAKTLVELQGFQAVGPAGLGLLATSPPPGWVCKLSPQPALPCFLQPAAQGAFLRGSGLSLASGRFTAPVTAIFQFSASLHVGRCRQSCLRRLQRAAGQGTAAGPGHGAGAGLHRVPVPSPHVSPWRPSLAWRAVAGSSRFTCRGCCSCRLDSMPLSSWTTAPGWPSPSRVVPASPACSWAREDTDRAAGELLCRPPHCPLVDLWSSQ
ncbi:adipolin isoform X1 [Camelus ferus]|uniref:Adipolin isoform X1 n=1 Tax=Camelus ferus TaxID=419612 RepID=A0A8B8U845_CAMFR|nr:adipolin isoform X1 [Camelus ferus]